MSTFGSGQAPIAIKKFQSTATGATTIYTVPSGRYAKVYILVLRFSGTGTPQADIGDLNIQPSVLFNLSPFKTTDEVIPASGNVRVNAPYNPILLDQNETIESNFTSGCEISFLVEEFTRI